MKKIWFLYPFLFAAYPVLALYSENQSLIPLSDLWRPLAVVLAAVGALLLFIAALSRSWTRSLAPAALVALSFLNYFAFFAVIPLYSGSNEGLGVWFALTVLLALIAAWKWKWHQVTTFFAIALALFPIGKITYAQVQQYLQKKEIKDERRKVEAEHGPRPDIVYIILDGYGRTDVLEKYYGFSNKTFIDSLKKRGFYIATKAHANFCQTELSLSSSLNYDFVQNLDGITPPVGDDRPGFSRVIQNNRLMARLKQAGYQTAAISSGFPSLTFNEPDIKVTARKGLSLFESTLMQTTPLAVGGNITQSMFDSRRTILTNAFAKLRTAGRTDGRPRITFAHILAPHPPFVFDRNGKTANYRTSAFGFWDGSDFMEKGGSPDMYKRGYSGQAQYIADQVITTVDQILADADHQPIIVIQSDHGPKMLLNQSELAKTDVTESFPILNAYLVPDSVRKELYPSITPVNTFRTILRTLFKDDLPNLPDRSWYSPYGRPLKFTEVTDRLK